MTRSREEVEQMILDNQKLVYFVVNKWYPQFRDDDDITQNGMIGLWNACESFQEGRCRFSTYAVRCIRNEIAGELERRNAARRIGETVSYEEYVQMDKDTPVVDPHYSEIEFNLPSLEKRLGHRDFTMFRLYIDGASYAEIGRQFNLSRQRVFMIVQDASKLARRVLYY